MFFLSVGQDPLASLSFKMNRLTTAFGLSLIGKQLYKYMEQKREYDWQEQHHLEREVMRDIDTRT